VSSVEESNAPSVPHGRKGYQSLGGRSIRYDLNIVQNNGPNETCHATKLPNFQLHLVMEWSRNISAVDYKEHGTRNKEESSLRRDETALSSPSLSSWSSPSSRSRDERSSSSSGSNDSGLSSRSSSSSGSPSSTINSPDGCLQIITLCRGTIQYIDTSFTLTGYFKSPHNGSTDMSACCFRAKETGACIGYLQVLGLRTGLPPLDYFRYKQYTGLG
ncbi:unnamed protein product, partial [Timema podura]|nr:unnamed protein product [Timema podura]